MATTLTNSDNEVKMDQYQSNLTDAQLFSVYGEGNETDLDGTTEIEMREKELRVRPTEISAPVRLSSGFAMEGSSVATNKYVSRSYEFIQLERALTRANLLKTNDDRSKFESEYLESVRESTFDQFLHNYYQKIRDHYEHVKQERAIKKARAFTFLDLEKKFRSLDPTQNIKIVFIDDSTASTITKTTNSRSSASANPKSTSSTISDDAATEAFYAHQSHRLLHNPKRAREEITLFSRRAAERLQERLPRLSSVPHRVKIVDERDTSGKPDERTLLQMKHKHALSLMTKRRQLIIKMMTQSKKNQNKMEQQWKPAPLSIDNASCCRELLETANQIEQIYREEKIRRPQTGILPRRTASKTNSSSASSQITTTSTNIEPTLSSCSTSFQDALSIYHVEKTKNVRVIQPTRPLTASAKVAWVNYC